MHFSITLRTKITIFFILTLVVVVYAFNMLVMEQAWQQTIDIRKSDTTDALADERTKFISLMNESGYYYSSKDETIYYYSNEKTAIDDSNRYVMELLAKYYFQQNSKAGMILMRGDETIYNNTFVNPYETFQKVNTSEEKSIEIKNAGEYYILAKQDTGFENYTIYYANESTSLYDNMNNQERRAYLILIFSIGLGVIGIIFFMRQSFAPLDELKKNAKKIENGDFDCRCEIKRYDEVGIVANSFNEMTDAIHLYIDKLNSALEQQKLFIAGATHEFKTPLTSLIGYSDTLINTKLDEESRDIALNYINKECKRLEKLIQKLMTVLTISGNEQIDKEPVYIEDLFKNLQEILKENSRIRQVNTAFVNNNAGYIEGDKDLLISVMVNLIDNAMKASLPGNVVNIEAGRCTDKNEAVYIKVIDHGVGIPKESIEHITNPFYMVDKSRSKKLGGTGLGLTLVSEIVKVHGAVMNIESESGKGTCITIIFAGEESHDKI